MTKSTRLTPLAIERAKARSADWWLSDDEGARGGGRLVVRVGVIGSKLFYYRYSLDGARRLIPIGPFCERPTEGRYTLEQARAVARGFAELHRAPESRDVAAYLQAKAKATRAMEQTELAAEAAARREADRASRCTVQALCNWYVAHLEKGGKVSAADARTIFTKNVYGTEWAALKAASLTGRQAAALIRSVVDRGKGRTASKLRSYLRAAYGLALKAELDPTAPAELIEFGVVANPVADTAALSSFNRTRDRVLTEGELGALCRRLPGLPVAAPLALHAIRLSLLLGGQRVTQLLRVELDDVDLAARTLTMHDGKGRRAVPRKHVVPLSDVALDLVRSLVARSEALHSSHLFASGGTQVVSKTVSDAIAVVVRELIAAKEIARPFQARDLRRTAETMLASLGVSKDVRAQLQSHGLGGVQDRHYDRHDYMSQKRSALNVWQDHLQTVTMQSWVLPLAA